MEYKSIGIHSCVPSNLDRTYISQIVSNTEIYRCIENQVKVYVQDPAMTP